MLRDALADLLACGSQYAPVVDSRGAVVGVLSIDIVSHLLAERDTRQIDPVERVEAAASTEPVAVAEGER